MYEICINEDGYYTNGCNGILVEVNDIPEVSDVRLLPAYKYDPETKTLLIDEDRLAAIQADISALPKTITKEERLDALESAVFELINNTYGGE